VKPSLLTFSQKAISVAVVGTTKGKGFQGVVKRHGLAVVLVSNLTVSTTVSELRVLSVTLLMPAVYSKECAWQAAWVATALK
jgi:hypothetical protein